MFLLSRWSAALAAPSRAIFLHTASEQSDAVPTQADSYEKRYEEVFREGACGG